MSDDIPHQISPPVYKGSWKNRRVVVFCTLAYCAVVVLYLAIHGSDTALHQQIAIALVGLAGGTIGSYVFGAVWDDHSIRKFGGQDSDQR